ncbi:SCUBE3 [Branchiostoma lanceolatum]|uniref:SCUBE3 protein n=1 Tax=Branchiostoma lanceolatum TaxID=7740 RepID=A0A8J9ZJT1_BRALA|nr:SCUBE3 [Branchiostoma lanceolatum]
MGATMCAVILLTPNRLDQDCPPTGYVSFSGHCFKYFAEEKTNDEAKQTCAADGALLAMPKDSATNSFIAGLGAVAGRRWIGLTDIEREGQWVFADGQELGSVVYSSWEPACPIANHVNVKGICYQYFAEAKTYDEARQTCAAGGALLAMSKDSATNSFIAGFGKGDCWAGLTDAQTEGQWVFADGQTLESAGYANWNPGEPDNGADREDCGVVRNDGRWSDWGCDAIVRFICQLQPVCPIADYVSFKGTCYKDFAKSLAYDAARQTCAADGGLLAMPKDSATNSFIASLKDGRRWVGLTDEDQEGQWVLADDQSLESAGYSNWYPGEPNGGLNENCVRHGGNMWADAHCNLEYGFICQIDQDECATDNGGCDHICTNVPETYKCSCRQGFALMADGHGCEDIDECATDSGGCDQICSNVPASYGCSCRQGFVLTVDGHGCEVCGYCHGGDVNCDPISGVCSAGCQVGWKTQLCNEAVDPPANLAVTDVTQGGFNVMWSPSIDPDLQGYRVVVSKLDMTTAVNRSTDQASFLVAGLSPETYYVIKVTSLVLSAGWRSLSEEATIHAATGASSSTDLQFVEVTDYLLAFTWVPPDAVVTGYRIMYGREEAAEQLIPSPGPEGRSAVIIGLQPDTMYTVEITTIGVYRESSPLVGQIKTAASPTTPYPAATTRQTSRMTTTFSTSSPSTSTPLKTRTSARDQGSSADDEEIDSDSYDGSEPQESDSYSYDDSEPTTESNRVAATGTSRKSPGDVRATSSYQAGHQAELEEPTLTPEETAKDKALDVLQSITSTLDEVDMSDPATLESVGGSLLESVGTLLDKPKADAVKNADGSRLNSALMEDESLSPAERLQKVEEQKQEKQAKRRSLVQESRRVMEKMEDAITKTLKPGDPPVTLKRGGVTLTAQKVLGSEFGDQEVRTEDGGCFQLPSQTALFLEHAPHSVTIKMKQFEENPFTWGSGEHQVSSTVMELSLQQSNNDLMTFNNLTEDFVITIPGSSKHKMATQNVTFASTASKTAMYHSYNLTGMADGFLVTIIPLNLSVIYGVSGRYGGRPDDQNYNVSMETYVLPEQCALMKTLSGEEDDTDKTKATIFIKGEKDPEKYYVKINILGPVTECDVEEGHDTRESDAGGFYSYQIQWARLSCRFWNETQEAWMTDGCAVRHHHHIIGQFARTKVALSLQASRSAISWSRSSDLTPTSPASWSM